MEKKFIVAVTACPTGIAHTFMAETALRKAADGMDVEIRIETDGASGIGSPLTADEISRADAVIIAADKIVQLDRFAGKPMLKVSVGDGVRKAKELIETAINTELPIHSIGDGNNTAPKQDTTIATGLPKIDSNFLSLGNLKALGSYLYRVLMSGVSNMLPFVVAGGVLIAISFLWGVNSFDPRNPEFNKLASIFMKIGATSFNFMIPIFSGFLAHAMAGRNGFVAGMVGGAIAVNIGAGFLGGLVSGFLGGSSILILTKVFSRLPKSLEGVKSIFILPVLSLLIVGFILVYLGTPIAGINKYLIDTLSGLSNANPIILGLIIGSMMAFDMGGPVNKAAYVTGTMLLGSGNNTFMAGVMAAGMTPPLVTAIATTFFRKEFNDEEKTSGMVNYILSATFISEGAIPFAARNPLVMIPIFMFSSSISAVLTYLAKVEVKAPHGGLLILPLTTNPHWWILSIIVGGAIGGLIFGFLKKAKRV